MAKRLAPLSQEYKIDVDPQVFNKTYLPYLYTVNHYEVYYGGSGSGKSNFIASKLIIQLTLMAGRNLMCLRRQSKDCRDSVFNEIRLALDKLNLRDLWEIKEYPEPRMINRVNDNTILFSGLDDVENVKSIKAKNGNFTDAWIEEANEIDSVNDIRELDRRLRDTLHRTRLIISFNPISRTHWLYDWIHKELKGTDSIVLKTTYRDNRFLNSEYVQMLERYRYTDPYSYQVYALGEWGTTGQTVFNANKIHERLMSLIDIDFKKVEFAFEEDENGKPDMGRQKIFANPDGETTIFEDPKENHPYVIGFDTAGEGSDYYAAHVIDNTNGKQVATYHSQRDPSVCIKQIYALGRHYNTALLCPEINFDSYPLKKLQEWGYENIYRRRSPADSYHESYEPKLGFRTTSENRQRILSELVEWTSENIEMINDKYTLDEMLTFTRQAKKMKGIFWAAENGAHDDLVMALAITLQAREQQFMEIVVPRKKPTGFYLPEEIDLLVASDMMDTEDALELKQKALNRFGIGQNMQRKEGSRYDR